MGAGLTIPLSASADPPQYRIIDLHDSGVAANSIAYGINDIGEVVGNLVGSNAGGFVWLIRDNYGLDGRTMLNLSDPELIGGPTPAVARDINIYGRIIGDMDTLRGDILLWNLASQTYENLTSVSHLGEPGLGHALNNLEPPTIVGVLNPSGPLIGFRYELNDVPVLLQPAEPQHFQASEAFDVSDTDEAVGWTTDGTPPTVDSCGDLAPPSTHWGPGSFGQVQLGVTLTGIGSLPRGRFAYGINNNLDIVGESRALLACFRRGTIWPSGDYANPHPLPFIDFASPEDAFANAVSDPISRNGSTELHIVGRSEFPRDTATLWRGNPGDWAAYNLNEVSCGDFLPPLKLREAHDVNNYGWIVGWMTVNPGTPDARDHAFLLVPLDVDSSCPGDLNLDGVISVSDLLLMLSVWGECPETSCCLADLNGNGEVGVSDLLGLLAAWGRCPAFAHLQEPDSLETELNNRGLSMQQWDDFVDMMEGGTEKERANYLCWMKNYLTQCQTCEPCPDRDPFAN